MALSVPVLPTELVPFVGKPPLSSTKILVYVLRVHVHFIRGLAASRLMCPCSQRNRQTRFPAFLDVRLVYKIERIDLAWMFGCLITRPCSLI
jgi:hypothetical protein